MSALLFLEHGTQKLFNFPPASEPMPLTGLFGMQAAIELIGGVLLALGLFTRPVAFILSGNMALPILWRMRRKTSFPSSMGAMRRSSTASSSCIFAGGGAWSVDATRRGTGLATP